MITGFNTDIKHKGQVYHIQTEDKGLSNPVIESLVYKGGEILATRRSSYKDQLDEGFDEKELTKLMEEQHRRVIFDIQNGRLDSKEGNLLEGSDERTLDELVIEYLATLLGGERLKIKLPDSLDILPGLPTEFVVSTRKDLTLEPVPGSRVTVDLVVSDKTHSLFVGITDRFGKTTARFTVPESIGEDAMLVISAASERGQAECRHAIRRARK
ncbi:MAG: hypothetical protein AB1714_07235 [Acidobacteriota bacterium]